MAARSALADERAVWRRVTPVPGQVLDLLHARVTAPFAPHLHDQFAVGACTDGVEEIRYRGGLHYSGPGSVVVLEPGETHTGGPAGLRRVHAALSRGTEPIREVGPSRAMVFTYVNPAVAVAAGVALLGEPFTATIAVSFALILAGCFLATRAELDRGPARTTPEADLTEA
jgi:hypothetical protein